MTNQILNEVHWAIFIDLFLAICLLWVIKKFLDVSILDVAHGLIREFAMLLQLRVERGSINALTIVVLTICLVFFLFFDPFRNLFDVVQYSNTAAPESNAPVVIIWFFVTAVVGILSFLSA